MKRIGAPLGPMVLILAAALAARDTKADGIPTCQLHIELTDAATGHTLAGVVSLRDDAGGRAGP